MFKTIPVALPVLDVPQKETNFETAKVLIPDERYKFGSSILVKAFPTKEGTHLNGHPELSFEAGHYETVEQDHLIFTGWPVGAPEDDPAWKFRFAVTMVPGLSIDGPRMQPKKEKERRRMVRS